MRERERDRKREGGRQNEGVWERELAREFVLARVCVGIQQSCYSDHKYTGPTLFYQY